MSNKRNLSKVNIKALLKDKQSGFKKGQLQGQHTLIFF
jgi:hypothetical protein